MPYKILGQSLGKTAVFSDNSGQVLYLDSFGSEVLELYNSSIDPLMSFAHPPDELPRPSALASVWDSLWEADQDFRLKLRPTRSITMRRCLHGQILQAKLV